MLAPVNCEIRNSNSNVTDETYNLKLLENFVKILVGKLHFLAKIVMQEKTPPPPRPDVNYSFNHLETWHTYSSGATLTFH